MLSDQLRDILNHLSFLWFEISLILGAMVVLIGGMISKKPLIAKVLYVLALLVALIGTGIREESTLILSDFLVFDSLTDVLKLFFAGLSIWIVFFQGVVDRRSEFYFILLAIIAGCTFMLSANHLLIIYLAVELTSFGSYLITNFNFQKRSFEAGMKYLIFGGVSSAFALYGASLIYGFTGTLVLSDMTFNSVSTPALLNFGVVTFIGGLLFKISLVPFHIWTPSAYEEAPTEALPILSTLPKVAALVLLHRFLITIDFYSTNWLVSMVGVIGMATIVLGTLGALRQVQAKRLVGYGAIAHSGFLLAPLLIPGAIGVEAFLWYSIIYGFMNLAVFYFIGIYEQQGIVEIADFAGLGRKEAYLGSLLVIVMIALIGLPPTAGFTAKFYLFTAIWSWYQEIRDPMLLSYLSIAVLSIVMSLVFYLKIPYFYFLKESARQKPVETELYHRIIATILTGLLLWFFFRPDLLNKIAESINFISW